MLNRWAARAASAPTPPSSNLIAWYKKNTGVTASGGAVSAWADNSGSGNTLLQASGANQPQLQGDGSILFDGSNDFLRAAFSPTPPVTYYVKWKQVTWASSAIPLSGAIYSYAIMQRDSTPYLGVYNASTSMQNTAAVLDSYQNICVEFVAENTPGMLLRVAGTTTTGTANIGSNPLDGISLGAQYDGSNAANIQVLEVIAYSGAHDAATQNTVFAYLDTV